MSQFERIAFMDRTLRERGSLSGAEAARRFEVSDRQIKRDIEYLRDRLSAPVVYDRSRKAYRYAKGEGSERAVEPERCQTMSRPPPTPARVREIDAVDVLSLEERGGPYRRHRGGDQN